RSNFCFMYRLALHSREILATSRLVRSIPNKFAPHRYSSTPFRESSLHLTFCPLHSEKVRSTSLFFHSIPRKFAPHRDSSAPFQGNSLHLTFGPLNSEKVRSTSHSSTPLLNFYI